MKHLFIVGAGGNGKVAADIASEMGYTRIEFLDDRWRELQLVSQWKVVGPSSMIGKEQRAEFFCSIGDNKTRENVDGLIPPSLKATLVHPSAFVSRTASVGAGTMIAPGAVINSDARIGDGVIINTSASIDHDCLIDNYAHVSPGAHMGGNVTIGKRSWIGVGASLKNGVSIGDDVIVGVGSTVIRNVSSKQTVVGNPAHPLKKKNPAL